VIAPAHYRGLGGRAPGTIAMSKATKLGLSAIIVLIAAVLVLWPGSPLRPDMTAYVVVLAAAMVVVMWTFPSVSL
jgi:hypothetical protein